MFIALSLLVLQTPAAYGSVKAPASASFPFLPNSRDLVAIEVKINGKGPYLMGIDTCAAGAGRLSTKVCDELGLPQVGEVRAGDGTGQNMQTIKLREAKSLAIGDIAFSNVKLLDRSNVMPAGPAAPSTSSRQVDGILGYGLFRDLLLKIDFTSRQVTISKGILKAGADTVALDSSAGISIVNIRVSSENRKAHFDTGADGGLVMPEAEASHFKFKEPLRVLGRLKTNFNDIEIKGAPLNGKVVLGSLSLDSPIVAFAPIFRTVNFGRRLMQGHAFTFDQQNGLMQVE